MEERREWNVIGRRCRRNLRKVDTGSATTLARLTEDPDATQVAGAWEQSVVHKDVWKVPLIPCETLSFPVVCSRSVR